MAEATTPVAPVAAKSPVVHTPPVVPTPAVAKVVIPKFKTIGTGTITMGGIIFTKDYTPVVDAELAVRLRKLKTMFVEFGAEAE